eukprot:3941953-Rhodomonas_salina.3
MAGLILKLLAARLKAADEGGARALFVAGELSHLPKSVLQNARHSHSLGPPPPPRPQPPHHSHVLVPASRACPSFAYLSFSLAAGRRLPPHAPSPLPPGSFLLSSARPTCMSAVLPQVLPAVCAFLVQAVQRLCFIGFNFAVDPRTDTVVS